MRKKAIVWFRNDLRLRDNVTLARAAEKYDIIPVFVFDERLFRQLPLGFKKTGAFKAQFLIESVQGLSESITEQGGELIVRTGIPEDIIYELALNEKVNAVFATKEATSEEIDIENSLEEKLFSKGIAFELIWQLTLFHQEDVPWPIKTVPEVFTDFRKESEKSSEIEIPGVDGHDPPPGQGRLAQPMAE